MGFKISFPVCYVLFKLCVFLTTFLPSFLSALKRRWGYLFILQTIVLLGVLMDFVHLYSPCWEAVYVGKIKPQLGKTEAEQV